MSKRTKPVSSPGRKYPKCFNPLCDRGFCDVCIAVARAKLSSREPIDVGEIPVYDSKGNDMGLVCVPRQKPKGSLS